jgi:hypothetical protein
MSINPTLTKSKFKLGLECPNKLYFAAHSKEYANQKEEDTFLEALAQGGFQVDNIRLLNGITGINQQRNGKRGINYRSTIQSIVKQHNNKLILVH